MLMLEYVEPENGEYNFPKFLRQSHFNVWDHNDLLMHEVVRGLKNVFAIGVGNFNFFLIVNSSYSYFFLKNKLLTYNFDTSDSSTSTLFIS